MKICFLLHYPGYVRYFDSVFNELVKRGHSIHLVFNGTWKQPEGLATLPENDPNFTIDFEDFPTRADGYYFIAKSVRGSADYVRYLDRRFKDTPYLRRRMEGALPNGLKFLRRSPSLPSSVAGAMRRYFVRQDRRRVPSAKVVEDYLLDVAPDLLVVSPLVNKRSWQTDAVKSAQKLGIPVALCVASWDHLTTKGMIRLKPDKVFVWNPLQLKEAVELHDVPASDIVVTGAQPFDKWFDRRPSADREQFLRKVGLPADRGYVLFVGSTSSISEPSREVDFVKRWIARLRSSDGPLRDISVFVRPHPFNCSLWKDTELDDPHAVIYPKAGANPVDEGDRADYFDTIHHADAVMGINTSAMVEATILGRPVLSVLDGDFEDTQEGTLHFQYLLPRNGGFLEVAKTLDEHIAQLAWVIEDPAPYQERVSSFVDRFVRPLGRDVNATERLTSELESMARPVAAEKDRRAAVSPAKEGGATALAREAGR